MPFMDNPAFDDHEAVHFVNDTQSGLRAIIAIHSTALGPSAGGCRMWSYSSGTEALTDALRLSRGMTYKNAMADLPFGGGKAVILGQPKVTDREALFAAFGRVVEGLGGQYITAEDVGVSVQDMTIVSRKSSYVSGLPMTTDAPSSAGGDPSPKTARGVLHGIRAAAKFVLGRSDVEGLTVAVQGLGGVGYHLCQELNAVGAKLTVADLSDKNVERVVDEFDARVVPVDNILFEDVDVVSPCALGGILNRDTIRRLKARIVAGGANNQLLTDEDGERLRRRGIVYAPDYIINAGGIINVAAEYLQSMTEEEVWNHVATIEAKLLEVFQKSAAEDLSTNAIADTMALNILKGRG